MSIRIARQVLELVLSGIRRRVREAHRSEAGVVAEWLAMGALGVAAMAALWVLMSQLGVDIIAEMRKTILGE